jgi:calcineurin-like phosphoesterase family protein
MATYVISDTHFNHENIIKYCNRPFKDANHMNEHIIEKWNEVVGLEDTVYHLGDVGFGTNEQLNKLVSRLNGTKILLMGNHDFKRGVNNWKEVGFTDVYKKKIELDKYLLTHEPILDVPMGKINVFGHVHNKPLDDAFSTDNHFCVCCDVLEYRPIELDTIHI